MTHRLYIVALLCLAGSLLSCRQNASIHIVYEMPFEEIAQWAAEGNKHFAIILADPDCPGCRALYHRLFNETALSAWKSLIFNIVDVTLPQNRWYQQLIQSGARPTTLLFSPDAQLKAIIQGATRSGIECIINVLNGNIDCAPSYNNIPFPESISYEAIIRTLNLILTAKQKIDNGEDAVEELEKALNTLYYPFPLWLKMKNEQRLGYTEDAISWARQLLTFQESSRARLYVRLYSDLFLAARKVIDPDFDMTTLPVLEIENNNIHLGELQEGDEVDIRVRMRNSGQEPLFIHDINVGCSCLTLMGETNHRIEADDAMYFHLLFTAEQSGEIRREVRIANNGLIPTQKISIRASVR